VLTNSAADNVAAFNEVERFPEKHRDAVKEALGIQQPKP
jgi:hypothetical protein